MVSVFQSVHCLLTGLRDNVALTLDLGFGAKLNVFQIYPGGTGARLAVDA